MNGVSGVSNANGVSSNAAEIANTESVEEGAKQKKGASSEISGPRTQATDRQSELKPTGGRFVTEEEFWQFAAKLTDRMNEVDKKADEAKAESGRACAQIGEVRGIAEAARRKAQLARTR